MRLAKRATLGLVFAAAVGGGCALFAPKPAWLLPPPPIYDGPIVEAGRLHRATLENGLHVIVLEDFRLPRVALGVAVRRGAASDPIERAGLATYTAEVMERGAGDRDAFAFARAVDEIGASFDVSAEWDSMSVTLSGLSRNLDTLFSLLRDVNLFLFFPGGRLLFHFIQRTLFTLGILFLTKIFSQAHQKGMVFIVQLRI